VGTENLPGEGKPPLRGYDGLNDHNERVRSAQTRIAKRPCEIGHAQ
jgi:hypothetical protein